eukprot:CAMPEP_0117662630 /NCGR_PEP_ID=MMETSP0804-20121206/8153_1 /TAXON_ID=1074897 /ORGANISM="Tetraselmis astigmatica, Strain CCMP880" /LENGTH=398 /DNA_ID=CAMNT_0005469537 /DNA_START=147 /DNA_END=1344 /DNA_ORIENTATION=-
MPYEFTFKHRWKITNHLLSGITLPTWLGVVWRYRADIHWRLYWHRVAFLTTLSIFNTVGAALDWLLYSSKVGEQELHPEPVFLLGHPRTGTTHLHNLLAMDPRFAYANTFQVGYPSSFLSCEWLNWLLAPMLDKTRPMDNMALSFRLPQEDEVGTNSLTGGISPYMPIVFMKRHRDFRAMYEWGEEADPADLSKWEAAFLHFLKKVTFCHGGRKPLLIKSPVHTARVRLMLRLFPEARFVFIHRHPLEVFQSAAHMANTYYWFAYLQQPTDQEVHDFIIEQGELLHRLYLRDRHLIPKGRLHELSFSSLDQDPEAALSRIYKAFGWDGFESLRPKVRRYCASLSDFKKNNHKRLEPQVEDEVREAWKQIFHEFGYSEALVPGYASAKSFTTRRGQEEG